VGSIIDLSRVYTNPSPIKILGEGPARGRGQAPVSRTQAGVPQAPVSRIEPGEQQAPNGATDVVEISDAARRAAKLIDAPRDLLTEGTKSGYTFGLSNGRPLLRDDTLASRLQPPPGQPGAPSSSPQPRPKP